MWVFLTWASPSKANHPDILEAEIGGAPSLEVRLSWRPGVCCWKEALQMERALPETHEHTGLRPCSGYVEDCQPPGGTDVPVRCVLPHTEGWDTARTQTSPQPQAENHLSATVCCQEPRDQGRCLQRKNWAEVTTLVNEEKGCAARGKLNLFTLVMNVGSQLERLT